MPTPEPVFPPQDTTSRSLQPSGKSGLQEFAGPVIASIAQLVDSEIASMSRSDLMEVLRLSGQRFSTLDGTQQLYAALDRLQLFARLARDLCRQRVAAENVSRLPR